MAVSYKRGNPVLVTESVKEETDLHDEANRKLKEEYDSPDGHERGVEG